MQLGTPSQGIFKKFKEIPCITLESNSLVKKKKIQIIDFNSIYNYVHLSLNTCCKIHTCQTARLNITMWHQPDHNIHIDNLHTIVAMGTSQCIIISKYTGLNVKYKVNECQERKKLCFIQYQPMSIQNCFFNFLCLKSFRASFFLCKLFQLI